MEKLTAEEKKDLRAVLRPLYGHRVDVWRMNAQVLDLYDVLLGKSRECSRELDLVPRPYSGFGPKQYIKHELKRIARSLLSGKKKMYVTCLKATAYGMRQDFDMAGMGL